MPRAMWKGSLAFGLVNIPVELYGAVRDHRPKFRLLHGKDESPVRYERVCQTEGKPVAWEDLVKGYEYEKGHFVVLTKDDFKTAALEKTKSLDIIDFVDPEEVDERYFETPYYLQAGKGADRSYALLREAIRESGKIGIGKIILRDAQHLAAVEVIGDALVLTIMRFADELADLSDFKFPSSDGIRQADLKMARQLVDNLSAKWEPDKYTDEYVQNLMRVIQAKVKGRKPKLIEREIPRQAEVVDLMARLRASLERKEERLRPERGAKPPSESERGWGPASAERRKKEERPASAEKSRRGRGPTAGRPKKAAKSIGRRRVA
jgi:DNA end-binding protein Ku